MRSEIVANRGSRPPGVARWVNIDGIEYDADVVIGEWDVRMASNYLACRELRYLIAAYG